jgi:hypothetical protein
MRIAREEIFGPVVTVTRFSDEDEAVAIGTIPAWRALDDIFGEPA